MRQVIESAVVAVALASGEQQGEVAQLLPRAVVLARLVMIACLQSACDFLGKADANEAAGGHRIARPDEAYSLRGADDLAQAGRSQGTGGPILYIQDRRSVKMLESANGKHVNEIGSGATDVCRHHTADSTLVEGVMCRRDTVEPKGKEAIRWRRLRPEPLPARRGRRPVQLETQVCLASVSCDCNAQCLS